ncbi:MAG: hypothetical protein WCJ62_11955 [Flavobacterium sp.]
MAKEKKVNSVAKEVVALKIQEYISEGREVLLKKENEKTHVAIRYNNADIDGTKKWRILLNGNEFLVSEIIVKIPSRTETVDIKDVGIKHHISCLANQIEFKNNIAYVN